MLNKERPSSYVIKSIKTAESSVTSGLDSAEITSSLLISSLLNSEDLEDKFAPNIEGKNKKKRKER